MALLLFLSGLGTVALGSQTATNVPRSKALITPSKAVAAGSTCKGKGFSLNISDSMLSRRVEIVPPEEFNFAFEGNDSIQVFRVEVRQRKVGIDQEVFSLIISSTTARNLRPTISPPLLV